MNYKLLSNNFKEVLRDRRYLILFIVLFLLLELLFAYFTDNALIEGNFGTAYLYLELILQNIISVLFALFITLSAYKFFMFSNISIKGNTSGTVGGLLGVLVAGCPACSITIASYIGIAGILSLFPYGGVELKVISVPLLLYANYSLLRDLKVCKVKKK